MCVAVREPIAAWMLVLVREYRVHSEVVRGEIDADVDNGYGLLLPSELMRFATPSWHSLPNSATQRTPRDGEVPYIR